MELQQHFSVSVNDYEESEGNAEKRNMPRKDDVRTEDLYQSLNFPPTAHHGTINSTAQLPGKAAEEG